LQFFSEKNLVRIIVKGPRFLRYMIRRIVGACIHVASVNKLETSELEMTLQRRNPEHCLPNAPAQGLMLYHIRYEEDQVDACEFDFQMF
jgi:tRNA U38,U39,U40 pseudouridine synthase TruA